MEKFRSVRVFNIVQILHYPREGKPTPQQLAQSQLYRTK